MSKNIIVNKDEALKITAGAGKQFALIHNPDFVHPPVELYPLAPALKSIKELKAVVMDMDGTTTTTEELCIHSLEYMVRKITGRLDKTVWAGLDHSDYPNIIGNSTTKHVEFLIKKYQQYIKKDELIKSFIFSAVWTITRGRDKKRTEEVRLNVNHLLGKEFLKEKALLKVLEMPGVIRTSNNLYKKYAAKITRLTFTDTVKAAIDIYYQRYHEILGKINQGEGESLSHQLLSNPSKHLIEPMPGVLVFIAMIKGMLGKEIEKLLPGLSAELPKARVSSEKLKENYKKIIALSVRFEKKPVKLAVVTSSIAYEADIVLSEVFKAAVHEVKQWPVTAARKKKIIDFFGGYKNVYDAFITASDSNEIRLKPHRDLYSIALHQLAVAKEDFDKVMGLEDSESGTLAIRAAGIGLCVAVPFAQTAGHNLEAAAYVANAGIKEIILNKLLFIKQ